MQNKTTGKSKQALRLSYLDAHCENNNWKKL